MVRVVMLSRAGEDMTMAKYPASCPHNEVGPGHPLHVPQHGTVPPHRAYLGLH